MTAMMTEIESLFIEELDKSRPCQPYDAECSNTATWLCTGLCCGWTLSVCVTHKAQLLKNGASQSSRRYCRFCKTGLVPNVNSWYQLEPL